MPQEEALKKRIKKHQKTASVVKKELAKIIVGQEKIIDDLLKAVLANGNVLVEGVPGIAKTLLIRALAKITTCSFGRVQFTPDLLPTDIIGLSTYQEKKGFITIKGPIFNNFVLGDEINRAPPKVQSALLESMQEKQATIAGKSLQLPTPFFVLATQNPIEVVGTYPLPEAQLDRFIFKILMGYPSLDEEKGILKVNITLRKFEEFDLKQVITPNQIVQMQEDTKKIYLDKKLEDYIVRITDATRSPDKYNIKLGKYIEWGGSPRASIGMFIGSKAGALLDGQAYVTPHHIREVAHNVLRHRIIPTYEGQAEGIKTEDIIDEILKKIPVP